MDWRRLETEIVDIARRQPCRIGVKDGTSDFWAWSDERYDFDALPAVNLSALARELAMVLEPAK